MKLSEDQKLLFLQLVRDKKEVLMGAFSPTLTKIMKQEAWEEIRQALINIGVLEKVIPSIEKLHDGLFSDYKRYFKAKYDAMQKTGGEGKKMTQADEIMLEIIGPESATLKPVPVKQLPVLYPGSGDGKSPDTEEEESNTAIVKDKSSSNLSAASTSQAAAAAACHSSLHPATALL